MKRGACHESKSKKNGHLHNDIFHGGKIFNFRGQLIYFFGGERFKIRIYLLCK
jgi:hypothetical protein